MRGDQCTVLYGKEGGARTGTFYCGGSNGNVEMVMQFVSEHFLWGSNDVMVLASFRLYLLLLNGRR